MTLSFDSLTKPQQAALKDLVVRKGLMRIRPGWDGSVIHRHATMQALERLDLLTFKMGGSMGTADPTKRARTLMRKAWRRR